MSLKYVLAERAGLKFQPQNGWGTMRVKHLSIARTALSVQHFCFASVKTGSVGKADKSPVSL